jgi:hypothetical protein
MLVVLSSWTTLRGNAVSEVEIFTPSGVLAGMTAYPPLAEGGPDLDEALLVHAARWYPIDGGAPSQRGSETIEPDDILLVVTPKPEVFVHLTWYPIRLEVGPYRVAAQLPTHPGFDPERALARPGHTFIALADATIVLLDHPEARFARREHLYVNRYTVDKVTSALMLGHFFPGARLESPEPVLVGA